MNRRQFVSSTIAAGIVAAKFSSAVRGAEPAASERPRGVDFRLSLEAPVKLFDGEKCYAHPRAGIVPGGGKEGRPRVVMTLNTVQTVGSDVFKAVRCMITDDLGATWSAPEEVPELMPRMENIEGQMRPVALSDFWPTWHAKSKTLLGTGHTVAYTPAWKVVPDRPRHTAYATFDAEKNSWRPWQKLEMPDGTKFEFAGAGCTQRVDRPDGAVLLPIYFRKRSSPKHQVATVLRCSFDGQTLQYVEHGDELSIDDDTRGLSEPSLTFLGGVYYLTLRHPQRAYVTRSRDGLHFDGIKPWTFDDGSELGSYETQAHWVTHSDGLFLVYTRRGANNDHVFRHRAPLFIAQVDPERLIVLRETERELLPNRGARYGNFGVTQVSADETWVTDSEWMQPKGCEKYGSDGSVWIARLHWSKPNGAL